MSTDIMPQFSFEKLSWYDTTAFNMAVLMGTPLIFLSMIPIASILLIRDRRRSDDTKPATRGARTALWIILGISILNLVVAVYSWMWGYPVMLFGFSTTYNVVLGLGVLSAALTVVALVYATLAWKDSYWGIAGRAYYTLVTVAAVAFIWFLNYWNLLGWRF